MPKWWPQKKWITDNLTLKLLSLGFAIILWIFVTGQQRTELGLIANLRFDNMPTSLMMVNEPEDTLDVRVVGAKTVLFKVVGETLVYPLDLAGVEAGRTTFPIQPDRLKLPSGVRVTRISPSNVAVVLDDIISKEIPVRVELVGAPAEGYAIGRVEALPRVVTIQGAKNAVLPIDHISTEPISIIDAQSLVEKEVQLSIPRIALQSVSHQTVKALVEIVLAEVEEEMEEGESIEEQELKPEEVKPELEVLNEP